MLGHCGKYTVKYSVWKKCPGSLDFDMVVDDDVSMVGGVKCEELEEPRGMKLPSYKTRWELFSPPPQDFMPSRYRVFTVPHQYPITAKQKLFI